MLLAPSGAVALLVLLLLGGGGTHADQSGDGRGCAGTCSLAAREGRVARPTCRRGLVVTGFPTAVYGRAGLGCVAPLSRRVAVRRCIGRPFCTIPANDRQFGGDPCPRVKSKVLWVRYRCGRPKRVQPRGPRSAVPGPEGRRASASCPPGLVITAVINPFYGRMSRACNATRSYRAVAKACLRRNSCSVRASNKVFGGDPCRGVPKVLFWRYRCGKPASPTPLPIDPASGSYYSGLWGSAGERWSPRGRLPDQSYAGYMANERRIPGYPARFDVTDYGAKGDGERDDTSAFLQAIEAASRAADDLSRSPDRGFQNEGREGFAVEVPPGTYRITQSLEITTSNVVLRGAGTGKTELYFPKPLSAIYGNREEWSLAGTFLTISSSNPSSRNDRARITPLTSPARKGDTRIQVDSTDDIEVGSWVRIYVLERYRGTSDKAIGTADATQQQLLGGGAAANASVTPAGRAGSRGALLPLTPVLSMALANARVELDDELEEEGGPGVNAAAAAGSLDAYLYGEMEGAPSGRDMYDKADHVRFVSRVVSKGDGWIRVERALPYDLRLSWKPYVYQFVPEVQHSGFEGFTVRFAQDVYPKHHTAYGYNGIGIMEGANCWIRDVDIVNADNAVMVARSDFVTVDGVGVSVERPRWTAATAPYNGHHALWAMSTTNTLFTRFRVEDRYWHDVTFATFSENTVFSNGGGYDVNLDFHRGGAHNNLVSNVNLGLGQRAFKSGGAGSRGAHAAANNTWWNVYADSGQLLSLPTCDYGPLLMWVGSSYGEPEAGSSEGDNSDRRRRLLAGTATAPAPAEARSMPPPPLPIAYDMMDASSGWLAPPPPDVAAREATTGGGGESGDGEALTARLAAATRQSWCAAERWWAETVPAGARLYPADLHAAMVERRLSA